MGRDTVQLETAVSTISQEYLLEFTSEYGISKDLHPELPGPKERIVDFPESKVDERVFPIVADWRTSAPKDEMPAKDTYSVEAATILNTHRNPIQKQPEALLCLVDMDLFNLIRALNSTKVKTGTRPHAAHKVPLLTVTASRVIEMEDPDTTTDSFGVPSTIERSPLDFANENPSQQSTGGNGTKDQGQETVAPESTIGGKSLAAMGLGMGSTFPIPTSQDTSVDVSDPSPLSFANPQSIPTENVAQSSKGAVVAGDPESENTSFTSMVGSPESIYQPEWGDQRIQARENEIKNLEALLEAETDMKKIAKAKNAKLGKDLEKLRALFSDLQVSNDWLSQQVSTLQAQVTREEKLKAAFKEFKQYEDDRVEKRCAEMDARRRWVIGHGLRLAVMKCGESTELRQVFADVVSARIAKGMSEGLKYGVEHENANLDLEAIEAYNPEADTKYVAALYALRDLKYPMVDRLESLKDAPIYVIMLSLHLESDTVDDAPQWIREFRLSSSQLKIPVYPEVRDPKDP
nr:hypothetical protein [Tanacetum cinerariifolium]